MEHIKVCLSKFEEKKETTNLDISNLGLKDLKLRPYQEDGVKWLLSRYCRGHGAILGDEMGLGKTCQTISFILALCKNENRSGPHLIISPLSVLNNWKSEFSRFTPVLRVFTYVGNKEERELLRNEIRDELDEINVILTTFEISLKDQQFLQGVSWEILVVDEAHRLKNSESLLHQALVEFDVMQRVLLTGTPVQNNLSELYSLLQFIAPSVFKKKYRDSFIEENSDYSGSLEKPTMKKLHTILKPFILRRIKSDVVSLPMKSEVILYHGLTLLQKNLYKSFLLKDIDAIQSDKRTSLNNILMQLRKCVNHPYLFNGVEPEPFQLGDHLINASGKLFLLDKLLSHLYKAGHKVLIFSQFTSALDILQDYLGYRGYDYERLDGSVRGEERYLAVQNFNKKNETFIFLLSTKAGGQGLNLVGADTVIFVDSDFNPQNDLQAAARAHRIGQTRPVKVIRLIARSTVEEIILQRSEAKLKLTDQVIEGGQFSMGAAKESMFTDDKFKLSDIIKFGVDKLLAESDENDDEKVDFDQVLGKSKDGNWCSTDAKQLSTLKDDQIEIEQTENREKNMYLFEGTDYSKEPSTLDSKAFENLMIVAQQNSLEDTVASGSRRKKATSLFTLPETKPRRKLTPEELAVRNKKRAETLARKAAEEKEEQVRLEKFRREKRDKLWERNHYKSMNLPLDSGSDSECEDDLDNQEVRENNNVIKYRVGDVTHPLDVGSADAIVVHCVDDSGFWPSAGVFRAISGRSLLPEEAYIMAGKMDDLQLGDVHLVPFDDQESRTEGKDYVALMIAQTRDKSGVSSVKLQALSTCLRRLLKIAKEKQASVHFPRIGHNTPGFNWYGTERLIRKILVARMIKTSIYYFKQHTHKRKENEDKKSENSKEPKRMRNEELGSSSLASQATICRLPDFMKGVRIHFLNCSESTEKRLKRFLIAYDGDVEKLITSNTTHIVTEMSNIELINEQNAVDNFPTDIPIVQHQWLEDCFKGRSILPCFSYKVL